MGIHKSTKEFQLVLAVRKARGETIDLLELVLGKSEQWPALRSRILRIFGDRGLEGSVVSLVEKCDSNWNGNYEHND